MNNTELCNMKINERRWEVNVSEYLVFIPCTTNVCIHPTPPPHTEHDIIIAFKRNKASFPSPIVVA